MRKRRGDSPWSKLTVEQRKQMDRWYFDENLDYPEILERATKGFGVQASRQTLTAYFRHRQKVRDMAGNGHWAAGEMEELLPRRRGAGMSLEDLEARTVYCTAVAAYEMALVEPDKLRVKELRSLLRLLNENRRLAMECQTRLERSTLQHLLAAVKVCDNRGKIVTRESFEKMVLETTEVMRRVRREAPEGPAATSDGLMNEPEDAHGTQAEETGAATPSSAIDPLAETKSEETVMIRQGEGARL